MKTVYRFDGGIDGACLLFKRLLAEGLHPTLTADGAGSTIGLDEQELPALEALKSRWPEHFGHC